MHVPTVEVLLLLATKLRAIILHLLENCRCIYRLDLFLCACLLAF